MGKLNSIKFVKLPSSGGREPVNSLLLQLIVLKLVKSPSVEGMEPEN